MMAPSMQMRRASSATKSSSSSSSPHNHFHSLSCSSTEGVDINLSPCPTLEYEKMQLVYPRTHSLSSDKSSDRSSDDFKMSPPSSFSSPDLMTSPSVESTIQQQDNTTYLQNNSRNPSISTDGDNVKYPTITDVFYRNHGDSGQYRDIRSLTATTTHYPYNSVYPPQPFSTNYSVYTISTRTNKGGSSKNARRRLIADEPVPCALCKRKIENKHLLYALEKYWHEKCLKCDFCRKPLYKFGSRFYFRQGAKFCHEDFMR